MSLQKHKLKLTKKMMNSITSHSNNSLRISAVARRQRVTKLVQLYSHLTVLSSNNKLKLKSLVTKLVQGMGTKITLRMMKSKLPTKSLVHQLIRTTSPAHSSLRNVVRHLMDKLSILRQQLRMIIQMKPSKNKKWIRRIIWTQCPLANSNTNMSHRARITISLCWSIKSTQMLRTQRHNWAQTSSRIHLGCLMNKHPN